ncbi:protein FAM171B-like [Aulostomus maculatus]
MRVPEWLLAALLLCGTLRGTAGEFTGSGRAPHVDDDGHLLLSRDHVNQELRDQEFDPRPASRFNLKVQVSDVLSRQYLSQVLVEAYVNYTRTGTARTGADGVVMLHVPFQSGRPVSLVASRDGYVRALLPCTARGKPVFSSVMMSLLALTQGNIWLLEDSVLISDTRSDASSQPVVQFPERLLNLTDGADITSYKAYLTIPKLPSEPDASLATLGVLSTNSGYVRVDLHPVAAVSVQLFAGEAELNVSGAITISLPLPDNCGLQSSSVVPAWLYNRTVGAWMRRGFGTVGQSADGKLRWTFTAPHLGYWIAAPLSSTRGFFRLAIPMDFILHHTAFMMVVLGGALLIVTCLLLALLCCHRRPPGEAKARRILPQRRKDQSTNTCEDDGSSGDVTHSQDGLNRSLTKRGDNDLTSVSIYNGNVIANPNAVALSTDPRDLALAVPAALTENLLFYNQPVAFLHASAFFQLEEPQEAAQRSRSATLAPAVAPSSAASEPLLIQTPSNGSSTPQNQAEEPEDQVPEGSQASTSTSTSRGQYGLQESMSVPVTLNRIRENRRSMHAETEKPPSSQPPRAWFVSLEGKPAAEIHYAVSEQQRRRRPAESRDTSLDSGVDMSELNHTPGRRALERNLTFVKSTSSSRQTPPQ